MIDAVNGAIDKLKIESQAHGIELIGYSGGGAIAVLVAARRQDVINLRTIAGNLDHESLNRYHGVSALTGSLNPIDYAKAVSKIPQRHFVGSEDKVVPPLVAESFTKRAGDSSRKHITKVEGATSPPSSCRSRRNNIAGCLIMSENP